jgi:hypothetical protein
VGDVWSDDVGRAWMREGRTHGVGDRWCDYVGGGDDDEVEGDGGAVAGGNCGYCYAGAADDDDDAMTTG